ncbi:dipeptidase PepE [Nonlabens sp.]|uniref:dipeptidase PepE n=1 Tax=Nonlabens sp. TaxID=1888209 RepID=UPI003F69DF0E
MRNMIIASTSTIHGSGYLEYILKNVTSVLNKLNVTEVLFIPYARPGGISHDDYTQKAHHVLFSQGIKVVGIHTFENKIEAIENAQAVFTGGGNTFQLVKMLHDLELMTPLRKVIFNGTFYLGTSAGSNICGLNMRTTNDMPIVQPSSFKTTGAVGYNINPHYLDPIEGSTHKGETREQRIKEFHVYNNIPVIGLREGSFIRIQGAQEILHGPHTARVFLQDQEPIEVKSGYDFAQLV